MTFDDAWTAFAEADARVTPPADLERRVLAAVAHAGVAPPARRRRSLAIAAGLAATLAVAIAGAWLRPARPGPLPGTSPPAGPLLAGDTPPVPVPPRPVARVKRVSRTAAPARIDGRALPAVLMILGADPVRDTEPLQLVRLRLPREALQALGLVLLEPDVGSVVDLDVLVGEDGLPRDIRQVRIRQE